MHLGNKGVCIDSAGTIRWGWEYAATTPPADHLPPTRQDIDAAGAITETILFDPTDTIIIFDAADLAPGEFTELLMQRGKIKLASVGGFLTCTEIIQAGATTIERPHELQLRWEARRRR